MFTNPLEESAVQAEPGLPLPFERVPKWVALPLPTDEPAGWRERLRERPVLWAAVPLFALGLFLVLDGARKQRKEKPR